MTHAIYQEWSFTNTQSPAVTIKQRNERKSMSVETIGIIIQRERISRYWSVDMLSEASDIPAEDIVKYEQGVLIPCKTELQKLTAIFKKTL